MQMNGEYEREKADRGGNHSVAVFPKKITHHLREPLTIRPRPIGSREARIMTSDQRARNHVLRRLRRERFYVSMEEDSENDTATQVSRTSENPLEELSRTETIESVRKAVLALPERYREVVVLCDLQEMSYVEAAEILGCAVGTVRSRLHRARALLIEKMRPAQEEEAVDVKSARCFA